MSDTPGVLQSDEETEAQNSEGRPRRSEPRATVASDRL